MTYVDEETIEGAINQLPPDERCAAWTVWFLSGNVYIETITRPHILPEYHLGGYTMIDRRKMR